MRTHRRDDAHTRVCAHIHAWGCWSCADQGLMTRVCGLARLPESNDYKHLLGPLKKRPKGFKSVTGESRAMVYVYTGVLVLVVLLAVVHLAIKLYRNLNRCVCGVCGVYVCASHQVHESARARVVVSFIRCFNVICQLC